MLGFIIGCFIGVFFGFGVCALFSATDDDKE